MLVLAGPGYLSLKGRICHLGYLVYSDNYSTILTTQPTAMVALRAKSTREKSQSQSV